MGKRIKVHIFKYSFLLSVLNAYGSYVKLKIQKEGEVQLTSDTKRTFCMQKKNFSVSFTSSYVD